MSTNYRAVASCVVLIGVISSACRSQLGPGITCEAVRALKYDMTESEVIDTVGTPLRRFSLVGPNQKDPVIWAYNSELDLFGGLRFELRFSKSRLTTAEVYATRLRDSAIMNPGDSKPTLLYVLHEHGRLERPEFSEYFTCR